MADRSVGARLAGQRVLLTGVTGFVGQALLQLLLAEVPEIRLVVLVRAKGSESGEDRLRQLLGREIFTGIEGDADSLLGDRLTVIEGTLSDVPPLPGDLDAVVHCAGDVSFDPPVDEGFRNNVVGTRALLERVRQIGDHVHYVHVSTAYVAGRRRGFVPEAPVDHSVDVEAELEWAGAAAGGGAQVPERGRTGRDPGHRGAAAQPRGQPVGGHGHRGEAQGVGPAGAGPDRRRTGPQSRLDRLLHLHQGARRTGC